MTDRIAAEMGVREAERRLMQASTAYAVMAEAGEVDDGRRHDAVLLAEIDLRKAQENLYRLMQRPTARLVTPSHSGESERAVSPSCSWCDATEGAHDRPPRLHGLRKRLYTEAMWWRYLSRVTAS